MDKGLKSTRLSMLVFMLLLGCSYGQQPSRTFSVNDWTGSWSFTGFGIGNTSGDYYHLLSSADANQCALIRETVYNSITWAKLYANGQCAGLTFGSSEDQILFASNEAATFNLYSIHADNGTAQYYLTEPSMNISGGIGTILGGQYPGKVLLAGNIRNNMGESCAGFESVTSSSFICSSTETYLGGFVSTPSI